MLEVADRLIASIGQDTMDTFFWSLTHPSAFRLFFHFSFAVLYMFAHSFIMLLQGKILEPSGDWPSMDRTAKLNYFSATTLNVAFNNHNKVLLLIMMSNNFIEIKGSVFKKFEKNNLFQVKHILWVMIIFITRLPVPMFANDFIYSGFYTLYWFEIWANVIGQLKQLKIFYHIWGLSCLLNSLSIGSNMLLL